jgi:hypothetical protein
MNVEIQQKDHCRKQDDKQIKDACEYVEHGECFSTEEMNRLYASDQYVK